MEHKEKFKTMIGGQALIEGIMMRGPKKQCVAVRSKNEIITKTTNLKPHDKLGKIPFIRGPIMFASSMVNGVKALMYSAEVYGNSIEDENEQQTEKKESGITKAAVYIAAMVGMLFSIFLFFFIPIVLGNMFQSFLGINQVVQNLIEGAIRIAIFLGYMAIISQLKDMKKVFQYHGAEHKTIRCYEAKLPLTVENVRPMTRFHPRCGTSFLLVVMVASMIVFILASYLINAVFPGLLVLKEASRIQYNLIMMAIKIIILLPIVVAFTYELNRFLGRHDNCVSRILVAPGLWLQRLTTKEPTDEMIEVAIAAVNEVLPEHEGEDAW